MPTIFREGPYRIHFYPKDGVEPPHVHIARDSDTAKVWLSPVRIQNSQGFRPAEVRNIVRMIERHREELLEAWDDFFGR